MRQCVFQGSIAVLTFGSAVLWCPAHSLAGNGDYDGDGDVDTDDFAYWAGCMTGEEGNSLSATSAQEPQGSEWKAYRDAERHFKLRYPTSWKAETGLHIEGLHRDIFLTINNAGRDDFCLFEHRRGREPIADILPAGSIYIEFAQWSMRGQTIDLTLETDKENPPANFLDRKDPEGWEELGTAMTRSIGFRKWGERWNVRAYMFEPVKPADLATLARIMDSFEFEDMPVGFEPWAVVKALGHMPQDLQSSQFVLAGPFALHWTQTKRICDAVLVTFGKLDSTETEPDRIWQFLVTRKGQVVQVLEPRGEQSN